MTPTQALAPPLVTPQTIAAAVEATVPPRRSLEPVVNMLDPTYFVTKTTNQTAVYTAARTYQ